ncbi:CapA family protein [Oceanobacillus piezotolerans]|uniref:CapA family protein n=1 Tax=Oceanobacillus piezotolerans TaxID=2448030 RepID=A0A498D841_9BACI|nr:CapA family protein [Oceanobacillus piezotolerans]RLL42117.1 CapA family protein [Oceanobacillus piezotolerans]
MSNLKFIFAALLLIILTACSEAVNVQSTGQTNDTKNVQLEEKEIPEIKQEISLSAVGDILIHQPVYQDARGEKGYNFSPMFELVEDYLMEPTITVANQETMIGGEEIGLSSYPSFNSPYEVGDALKKAGVDVVTIANNHTLDRGEKAIQNAIGYWETIDMMYTGAYRDNLDRDNLRIYDTEEGISLAFLSYTYGTNGIPVPEDKEYLVNLIDKERMANEMEEAKEQADLIVLSLHFGNEYERLPNESQKELVQFAADHGADIVIGHHPHVLQPVEWVTGEDGNKTFVVYSLGNFLSNQQDLYTRIGGIINLKITKTIDAEGDTIEVHSPSFLPTYVNFTSQHTDYEIVPMHQLTDEQLKDAKNIYQEIKEHMSQWEEELEFVEE